MTLLPARHNFTIWRGGTFNERITLLISDSASGPKDLTGYSGQLLIRNLPQGASIYTMTNANAGIVFGDAFGTIDLIIPASVTSALAWTHGSYDLIITAPDNGDADPILWGSFQVKGMN